jgi:hypothetical protein
MLLTESGSLASRRTSLRWRKQCQDVPIWYHVHALVGDAFVRTPRLVRIAEDLHV